MEKLDKLLGRLGGAETRLKNTLEAIQEDYPNAVLAHSTEGHLELYLDMQDDDPEWSSGSFIYRRD